MADENWYYAQQGVRTGPISLAAMQALVGTGQVQHHDLVWTDGMANWLPAASVASLSIPGSTNPAPGMINYYTPPLVPAYAGFWIRFCAAFIDGILIQFTSYSFKAILLLGLGGTMDELFGNAVTRPGIIAVLVTALLTLVGGWLYEALMTSSVRQATLGKMAVGIQVTDMTGARISFGRASGRYFAKIISGMIVMIGYVMASFMDRKQSLHDLIASTLVLKKTA